MAQIVPAIVELPNGSKMHLDLNVDVPDKMDYVSPTGGKAVALALTTFEHAIDSALAVAKIIHDRIAASNADFAEAEVSFGIEFRGGADIKVVSFESAATLQLTLRYQGAS